MTNAIRSVVRMLVRLAILWLVDAISLWGTSAILPGVTLENVGTTPAWVVAVSAALVLAIVNLLIRPIILMIARPLGWIALFVIGFLVNALALWITASLLPGFSVNFLGAVMGGIVFAIFNVILTSILEVDEEGSLYQNRAEQLAARSPFAGSSEAGRGLVMMEIDGLSYHHLQKALADGMMPTLKQMIDEEGYVLSHVDCGIPSQTSACQAGIMFGDNYDIPAFRWFDKTQQKLIVSGKDAAELNARYAKGNGLMRGGSSIDNMLNGDAEKSMLTMADLMTADSEQSKRRAEDVRLLMLNPYFLTRTIALFLGTVIRELWEGWQQRRKDVQPRLKRTAHFYPFVRAATSVLVRDIAANLTILDIMRGAPSIYVTWPGYDEVAHHSGPWTSDAFGEIKRYDRVIARVRRVIKEKAPRAYDLILLSDHGQSFGPTFKMRYGISIKEYIEQLLPTGTAVSASLGGDTGVNSLTAVGAELGNIQSQGVSGTMGNTVAKQGQKLIDRGVKAQETELEAPPAQVTAFGSGNLAQVYFDLYPRKITLNELNAAYPGMVDALVQHEGIGLVCGYLDDGTPVAIGKNGQRNLHTDEITGEDPLTMYAPSQGYGVASIEKRAWQVRRVMDFPHAGDLMVLSTVYADGTVAALEELIGSHGGIGGEQTDAFIFHPPDLPVPDTRNSTDVFTILNNRRGTPVAAQPVVAEKQPGDWAPHNLAQGIRQVGTWLSRAVRCITLDRGAYQEVVLDRLMTGPALLIGMAMLLLRLAMIQPRSNLSAAGWLVTIFMWFVAVAVVFAAGYVLTKRGTFTKTLRAVGFANSVYVLELLALWQPIASVVHALTLVLAFLAVWMGVSTAHQTRGWRTIILPIVVLLTVVVGSLIITVLLAGGKFTLDALFGSLGVAPQ